MFHQNFTKHTKLKILHIVDSILHAFHSRLPFFFLVLYSREWIPNTHDVKSLKKFLPIRIEIFAAPSIALHEFE